MLTPSQLGAENKAVLGPAENKAVIASYAPKTGVLTVGTASPDATVEIHSTCPRCKVTGKIVSEQIKGRPVAHVVGCKCHEGIA